MPSQTQSGKSANVVEDIMSSEKRGVCDLAPEEQAGLRRIVHDAKPPTENLRALINMKKPLKP